jgi:Winged helix DNA-binding domain
MSKIIPNARERVMMTFVRPSRFHPWPTLREICKATGISSTSVARYHIGVLIDEGLLKTYIVDGGGRCTGLTEKGEKWLEEAWIKQQAGLQKI